MLQAIILGIIQGLTEFLPVSSSGHLVVLAALFGWEEPSLGLVVVLHLGTLIALFISFRKQLIELLLGLFGRGKDPEQARRLLVFLVIGSIPAAIAGIALEEFFERQFSEPLWVCVQLIGSAGILLTIEWWIGHASRTDSLNTRSALIVGAAQAVAIVPGISRSGATIAAGMGVGLDREEAVRFSFLLVIPAILGATLLTLQDASSRPPMDGATLAGFVAAGISGWIAIEGFMRFVRARSLKPFAIYLVCFASVSFLILLAQSA